MIINEWDSGFTSRYGHVFPESYMTFDTEFTGNNEHEDVIVEIGHTIVEDGKLVDKLNIVLNWYAHPDIKKEWLDYKLNTMRSIVGPGWTLMPEKVKEGIDPIKGLRFYEKLFRTWDKRELPFVAQNGQAADERLIRGNFNRFLNKPFVLPQDRYFDTGAIFKASAIWDAVLGDAVNFKVAMLPHRTETLKQYFNRVIYTRVKGVKWSLSQIMEDYGLTEKHAVDKEEFHTAGFDAMCLHWIMEEYRNRITRTNDKEQKVPLPEFAVPQKKPGRKPKEKEKAKAKSNPREESPAPGTSPKSRFKRRQRLI